MDECEATAADDGVFEIHVWPAYTNTLKHKFVQI